MFIFQMFNIYVYILLSDRTDERLELYANVMKILITFKNFKTLFIYINRLFEDHYGLSAKAELREIIELLDINGIMKYYKVKHI